MKRAEQRVCGRARKIARKGSEFIAGIRRALCVMALVMPALASAGEVDLEKPVEIQPNKGVAVFSITLRGATQAASYIKWREVKEDKRMPVNWDGAISITRGRFFGTEELSESPRRVSGRLAALMLPPGTYEFYDFNSSQTNPNAGGGQRLLLYSTRHPFSRRFSVAAGKIQYVGNLDIYEGQPFITTGGILSGVFLGMFGLKIEVFPSLLDMGDADIPLIVAKGNGLNAADILRNITIDPEDMHTQAMLDGLRSKAGSGDVYAQRRLLLGLQNGLVMNEAGEEFKVQKDGKLQQAIAEQLSAKGVSGGDYNLGILREPMLELQQMDKVPATADGPKLMGEVLADAGRYFRPAMDVAQQIYIHGLPGVKEDREQASLWMRRQQSMSEMSLQSVPYLDAAGKAEFKKFDSASKPRYFALSPSGAYGMSIGDDASVKAAVAACEARNGGAAKHCRLYARNDWVEWDACPAEYAGPMTNIFPPMTGIGKIDEMAHLPTNVGGNGKTAYRDFLKAIMPRAFAVADTGESAMASGDCHAAYEALQKCHEISGKACKLYALDDQIVLGASNPVLVEEEQRLAALVEEAVQSVANGKLALRNPEKPVQQSMAGVEPVAGQGNQARQY